ALETSGKVTYIEYELAASQTFTKVEAETVAPGSVMKREFFELTTGPAEVYLLTALSFPNYPKQFTKAIPAITTCIKACGQNFYCDGPSPPSRPGTSDD